MAYNVSQIKNIVNDSVKDALGKSYGVTKIDTTDFVSLGKTLADFNAYDGWFSALANRIIKTIYFARTYSALSRHVLRDEHEYGAFVQKIYYKMPDAVDNPTWDIPDSGTYGQASPYDVETTISVTSKIFGNKGTWSIEFIRPLEQIKSAFLNEAAMISFIDGMYIYAENAFVKQEEALVTLAVNTAMASALDGGIAFNILAKYNIEFNETLTPKQALVDADFLRYASKEINRTADNMSKNMSTVFNKEGYETFTPKDKLVVEVLSEFASATDMYLYSDTFHKELVALPNYESIPFWQSSGPNASFDFDDCSKISIEHDGLSADVEQGGIIAFLRDDENVAAYFGSRRTWEMINPRSEVMIHGEKGEKGFAVDNNANAVVFYMGTSGTVSLASITHGSATLSDTNAYRGNKVLVTVTPTSGYKVKSVKVGDESLIKVSDNVYAYNTSDSDAVVTVTMESAS